MINYRPKVPENVLSQGRNSGLVPKHDLKKPEEEPLHNCNLVTHTGNSMYFFNPNSTFYCLVYLI